MIEGWIFSVLFCDFSHSEYYIYTLNDDGLTSFFSQGYHSVQGEWSVGSFDREILVPWTHRSHQETANEKSCFMMHSSQSAAV